MFDAFFFFFFFKNTPGFSLSFTSADALSYSAYLNVILGCHKHLTAGSAKCLESKEYLVMRNALQLLTKVVDSFPQIDEHAKHVEQRIKILVKQIEMEDLQLMATRYEALLAQKFSSGKKRLIGGGKKFFPSLVRFFFFFFFFLLCAFLKVNWSLRLFSSAKRSL